MAMGAAKGSAATLQVEMVCLDELVPEDDRYRRLDELVDWSFVREAAAPYYADELGRPSLDPIVLVKLLVAAALEGIGSVRELLRVAASDSTCVASSATAFKTACPVHQTISNAHTRRFVDAQLFERLFARSVALCKEHGLIEGTHLSIDGFHTEADAALSSLRASLTLAPAPEPEDAPPPRGEGEPEPRDRRQLALAAPRSGPTPRRRSSNRTSASQTDPDSKLRAKPGQRPHLVHRGQVGVDPKARCVVACLGEQADGHEGDRVAELHDRARFHCRQLASIGADQGFAAERVYADAATRGLIAFIRRSAQCWPRTASPRPTPAPGAPRPRALQVRGGVWAHKHRMADAEGVISELKAQGTLDRARWRGTRLFHIQLLLDCAAVNLKRLTDHAGVPAEGRAAGWADGGASASFEPQRPCTASDRFIDGSTGGHPRIAVFATAAGTLAWSFAVSLN